MTSHLENADSDSCTATSEPKSSKRSPKPLWQVSVSLEFDLLPVLTWRGEVPGASPNGAANAAVKAARKAFPNKKPRSWSIVLEKLTVAAA
jgi:hypothetical protein